MENTGEELNVSTKEISDYSLNWSSFPKPDSTCFISQEKFDEYALVPSFSDYFRKHSVLKLPPSQFSVKEDVQHAKLSAKEEKVEHDQINIKDQVEHDLKDGTPVIKKRNLEQQDTFESEEDSKTSEIEPNHISPTRILHMKQSAAIGHFHNKYMRRCKRAVKNMTDEQIQLMKDEEKKLSEGHAKRGRVQYGDVDFSF